MAVHINSFNSQKAHFPWTIKTLHSVYTAIYMYTWIPKEASDLNSVALDLKRLTPYPKSVACHGFEIPYQSYWILMPPFW